MKKLLSLLLVTVMIFSLASCKKDSNESDNSTNTSKSDKPNNDDNANDNKENINATDTPNNNDSSDDLNNDDSNNTSDNKEDENNSANENNNNTEVDNGPTILPFTICDNKYCNIVIMSTSESDELGYSLEIYLENKTSDKGLFFEITNAAINGIQCDTFLYTKLNSNEQKAETVHISLDKLKEFNITEITDVQLSFSVCDSEDFLLEYAHETTHIYPYGKDNVIKFERPSLPTDKVIFENSNVKLVVLGYVSTPEPSINIYALNKTNKDIIFNAYDVLVNDCNIEPFFHTDVPANCGAFDVISWINSDFEENGITKLDKVEMILNVYDSSSYRDIIEEKIIFYI